MSTCERLAEYAELLNRFGVDSQEAQDYLRQHSVDEEFVELAQLSRRLKTALADAPN